MKLGIYIKHMKAECNVPKSSHYDLVKGQGHFIKKLHESCLHASTTWDGGVLHTITRSL